MSDIIEVISDAAQSTVIEVIERGPAGPAGARGGSEPIPGGTMLANFSTTTMAPVPVTAAEVREFLGVLPFADGDKGDIVVSASGATWTIDPVAGRSRLRLPLHPAPTGGDGTQANPWTHADGTGGINTAITTAAGGPVHLPAGYYSITNAITGLVDGQQVTTDEAATVLVVNSAITDGLAITIVGTVGNYLENVYLGSLRIIRTAGGSIRLQYCRNSKFGTITCEGAGGGVFSLRDIERCQFDGVIGSDLGPSGAAVFCSRVSRCQFGPVVATGGQEIIDLFETHHCTFDSVLSINAIEECIDMGCCSYNVFNNVVAINPGSSGITVKIEDGGTTGAYGFNQFSNVTITGHTLRGIDIANSPATANGTDTNNGNQFDNVLIDSTVAGSVGVRVAGGTVNPVIDDTCIRNFRIRSHGNAITSTYARRTKYSDGFVESTNGLGILLDGLSVSAPQSQPSLNNIEVVSGGAGTSSGAVQVVRCFRPVLSHVRVVSSTGQGIFLSRFRGARISNCNIDQSAIHGINLEIPDDADWSGGVHSTVSNCTVRNIGTGGGTRWALRFLQTGATPAVGLQVSNNQIYDDQTVRTARGVLISGAFNNSIYEGNIIKDVVDTRSGSFSGSGSFMGFNIENETAVTVPSHPHGNISNAGAIGTTADLPISTTASGVINTRTVADFRALLGLATTDSPTFAGVTVGQGSASVTAINTGTANTGIWFQGGNNFSWVTAGTERIRLGSGGRISASDGIGLGGTASTPNVLLLGGAANTLVLRNSTNSQSFLVENTWTSDTNRETGFVRWASNEFRIGTEKGTVGGTARALALQTDGVTRITIGATGTVTSDERFALREVRVSGGAGLAFDNVTPAVLIGNAPWIIYTANGALLRTRDQVNGRDHIQLTAGASASAATTRFASAVIADADLTITPSTSRALSTNGQFSIEMTSNTAGNLVYRGSDGTTRRAGIPFGNRSLVAESFETVSQALSALPRTINYSSGRVSSVVYTLPDTSTITKTINYSGDVISSIVLSGATPAGIQLTKTITRTAGVITGVSYS